MIRLLASVLLPLAIASAPPVGPLPKGPTVTIKAQPGKNFVVSLPKSSRPGLVWRVARQYDAKVVRELKEGETAKTVWIRYRAVARGTTRIVYALTRGETSHAYAARTFVVVVR
jgi:predicted secreted protein